MFVVAKTSLHFSGDEGSWHPGLAAAGEPPSFVRL
jgi:hypothetical protein